MVHFGFHLDAGAVGTAQSVERDRLDPRRHLHRRSGTPSETDLAITLTAFAATCLALALTPTFWAFVVMSIPRDSRPPRSSR